MDELFKVAARSRGSIDGAAETFNRFGLALKDSNKPVEQLLVVTEAVQKAAVISGSGAESAKAAIIQLGQGLASGQLRGEELNSVLEQMPRLAQTIADGMGIPFGKLREEAMAGKITAEAVFSAILSGAYEIDEEFNTLNATVSGLATVFGNEWTRAVGELDKAIGTSNGIKSAIEGATLAVKFFGENIMKFAVLLQSQFLLAKISIRQFARDIKDIFKGIFSGEITSEETAEAIVAGFNKAKERVSKLGKVSVEFTIEKMDLMKDMLPSLATAQARIRKFTDYIVGLFKWAHNKIVGNSWWTSIWDSAKKKGGQVLAVGSSLATYLSVPMGEVSNFVSNLGTHFKNLYIDISAYWSRIATSIKEDGFSTTLSNEVDKVDPYLVDLKAKFADLSTSVKENYTDLRDEINEKGLKPTIEKGAVEVFNSTLETLKQSYATFNDSLTAILKVETGEESDVKALPTLPEIELKFKENKQSINNAIDATKKFINANPLFIIVKTIGQDLSTGFNGSFNEFGDYLSEKGAAASAIFSGVLFATLNTKLRRLVLSNALGAMFLFTAIKLQDDATFKAAVGKTAEGYGQLLGDYFRNNEGEVGSNVLSGIASLATTIGDGLLKGAFDGKDFSDTATSKITSGLIISLGALAISKKLRAGAVLAGRGIIGMMFGTSFGNKRIKVLNKDLSATGKAIDKIKRTSGKVSGVTGLIGGMIGFDVGQGIADDLGLEEDSFFALGIKMGTSIMSGIAFQMITTAAIAKLVNAIKAFAVASAINEAAKTTGFKIGAAIQKGLLVGLSVGMVAALSAMIGNAAKTAIDATIDKAGRLLTGQSSDEQQDSRIEAARNNKNLISGIAGGFINLDKTSEDTLIMLAKSITSLKEDKVFDIPANLSQLISGKSNLQVAIEKLEKAIEEKGINVQITRESFGRATPPGFAYGGSVNGPGTGKSDDIPAMLSNGEFVMQQSAVQKFGPAFMSAINRGKVPQLERAVLKVS